MVHLCGRFYFVWYHLFCDASVKAVHFETVVCNGSIV